MEEKEGGREENKVEKRKEWKNEEMGKKQRVGGGKSKTVGTFYVS